MLQKCLLLLKFMGDLRASRPICLPQHDNFGETAKVQHCFPCVQKKRRKINKRMIASTLIKIVSDFNFDKICLHCSKFP